MSSLWDHKPWWCQPWSIVLTGLVAITLSWVVLHALWFTALVTLGVSLWWWLFLVLVPNAFQQADSDSLES